MLFRTFSPVFSISLIGEPEDKSETQYIYYLPTREYDCPLQRLLPHPLKYLKV